MATRTITDRGSTFATFLIERNGAASARATVSIKTTTGDFVPAELGLAELAATLTAGERSTLAGLLDKLYSRALALEGFV
jgi:hypothetical protein